jgi:hypothetical protein
MSLDLPHLLAGYFAAQDRNETEGLGAYFTDNAVVRDEGRTIEGVPSIKQWMRDVKKKYHHTVELLEVVEREGKTVVTTKVAGNFPNSPVRLDHIFEIEGDRIVSLEIR